MSNRAKRWRRRRYLFAEYSCEQVAMLAFACRVSLFLNVVRRCNDMFLTVTNASYFLC